MDALTRESVTSAGLWPAWILSALLAGSAVGACTAPPPPLPPAPDIARALGCALTSAPTAAVGPTLAPARPAVHLYLDASLSMRGFLPEPARRAAPPVAPGAAPGYTAILEDLLGRLAGAGYPVTTHALCEPACQARAEAAAPDARRIFTPEFYTGRESPLAETLGEVARRPGAGGVRLIVSDMEQSAAHTDQRALIAAFRALAERTPELLLLCFQAGFGNPPPARHTGAGRDRRPPPLRRFYLLAVAPDRPTLAELQRRVLSHLPARGAVQPDLPPVLVRELRPEPAGDDPPWVTYRAVQTLSCAAAPGSPSGGTPARLAAFVERRPIRPEDRLRLRLRGELRGLQAIRSLADLQYEVSQLPPARPAALLPSTERPADDPDALILTVPAPRPAAQSWDAYRVRVRAGGGNLEVPEWVARATGPVEQGGTPHLDHLVRALLQAVTENVVFLDLLLALGRGE